MVQEIMFSGVELIDFERSRQVDDEGWTFEHDDQHTSGQMALAAACYASPPSSCGRSSILAWWPWDQKWWKPSPDNRIKELVKAGALIAAEIDRLQRLKTKV